MVWWKRGRLALRSVSNRRSLCGATTMSTTDRLPKRKVALMIGFNGTGYQGMQYNPAIRSIEQTLFEALCKAGAVSIDNSSDPKKVQLVRAARTDKGVHAVGNLVSLKMVIEDGPAIVDKINSHLPDQIRLWGFTRVTGGFHAKKACDAREYEYWLPSFCLMPQPAFFQDLLSKKRRSESDIYLREADVYVGNSLPEQLAARHAFRISPQTLDIFKKIMELYKGTHNFHNYTIGKNPMDPSAKRHMIKIEVDEAPRYCHGIEWLCVRLRGQSFMLHQIRKMIAMGILATRSDTPRSVIHRSFEPGIKINIPKAPALGLLLEQPLFNSYNQSIAQRPDRQPIHFEYFRDEMQVFKEKRIIAQIFDTEFHDNTCEISPVLPSVLKNAQIHLVRLSQPYPSMSRSLAEKNESSVEELIHAAAALTHIEKPYEDSRLALRKLKVFRQPHDTALAEAQAKLEMWRKEKIALESWTLQWFLHWCICEVRKELSRCDVGIEKANALVEEARVAVNECDEQIREAERQIEKNTIDHRMLTKYRCELTDLLDEIFEGKEDEFPTLQPTKDQLRSAEANVERIKADEKTLKVVAELLKTADLSLLEAVVELNQRNEKKSLKPGEVYFPENAYNALKEARELYPDLPGIPPPVTYEKTADDTGAYYSPMQKYLWDVRRGLADLMKWCDAEALAIMDREAVALVTLGSKLDTWNMERRQIVKQVILTS
ncbi:pseudouridine synthase [Dichotomocladium elegans]|nr:pseudouridine synthase [Dichotomocladium elegans]